MENSTKKESRVLTGQVVSDKMDKTIVVSITRTQRHNVLGKVVKRHKKYKVHDENDSAHIGDIVDICQCRPLSKTKHMTLVRIVNKAQG
jgi:small subunit ribosomal protein S17